MNDFEHLTDEELEIQIAATEQAERNRRHTAEEADQIARGQRIMWEITKTRLDDEIAELVRRKNAARTS